MKKSILLILFLVVLMATAFARHKKAKMEVIAVTIHRTACFGHCPDYQVEVDKNGMVIYTGNMFVKDSGTFKKDMGAAAVKGVIDECMLYRVDTCKDVYNNMVPDSPGLYFIIKYKNGVTKRITNASFGPGFLKGIANDIGAIAKVDGTWQQVQPVK